MNFGKAACWSRFGEITPKPRGESRKSRRGRRTAAIATILVFVATESEAQTAPPGMVPYDHPVYHHGKRVLWHWSGKAGEPGDEPATGARSIRRQASGSSSSYEFTVFSDGDDASAFRLAGDIVAALKAAGLRARPTVGRTAAHFLEKLAGNDAADFVVAPVDALVDDPKSPWKDKAPYVARLGLERIEIVAAKSLAGVADLDGRKVAVGLPESADEAVATALLDRLGLKPVFVRESLTDSLADLAGGKVDAVVATGESGSKALADFGKDGRFHVVAVPMAPALAAHYAPVRISAEERPNLVAPNAKVDALATPMALIAIDAPQGSARATRAAPFVSALFDQFSLLVSPAADPSWRDVNIAATLDWPRLAAAQDWIDRKRHAADSTLDSFRSLARVASQNVSGPNGPDAAVLFQSLMQARSVRP